MTQFFPSGAPQTFGPYVLERFLAAGGMAEVFLARRPDGKITGPLCVKRMLPEMSKTPEYVTMFRDECALSQRLVHDNIVRVWDYGEIDGRMYMAMELIDGMDVGSLQSRLQERSELLGVAHALKIGVDLCAGLAWAHLLVDEQRRPLKLIHRDVSPQNILVSASGQVKVTDFGIAKAVGRETHTATGLIKGKIAYMAPEQALGHYIDQRVDQFAAGIVVWEMVTGERLYNERSELLTFEKIIRQPPPRPSSVRAGVPGVVDQVVLRALAKSPDERWPDVAAFGAALAQALAQLGGPRAGDLAPVMQHVLAAHSPATTAPPPQLTSPLAATRVRGPSGEGVSVDGPTRIAPPRTSPPALAEPPVRLRTENMTPLSPLDTPATPQAALAPARTAARGAGGMRVFGPPSHDDTRPGTMPLGSVPAPAEAPLELKTRPPRPAAPLPAGMESVVAPAAAAQVTPLPGARAASTSMMAPAPSSRAMSLPLLAGALVFGLAIGFGAARLTAKPPRSAAECAVPSPSPEAIQQAAELMKRAEQKWQDSDFVAARRLALDANQAHGSPAAHMLLGRMALAGANRLEAFTHFRCVVALDPMGPSAGDLEKQLKAPVR